MTCDHKASKCLGVLVGQVPRLYGGTILGGCDTLRGEGSSGA